MADVRDGHAETTRPDEMLLRWPYEEIYEPRLNTKTHLSEAFREFL